MRVGRKRVEKVLRDQQDHAPFGDQAAHLLHHRLLVRGDGIGGEADHAGVLRQVLDAPHENAQARLARLIAAQGRVRRRVDF